MNPLPRKRRSVRDWLRYLARLRFELEAVKDSVSEGSALLEDSVETVTVAAYVVDPQIAYFYVLPQENDSRLVSIIDDEDPDVLRTTAQYLAYHIFFERKDATYLVAEPHRSELLYLGSAAAAQGSKLLEQFNEARKIVDDARESGKTSHEETAKVVARLTSRAYDLLLAIVGGEHKTALHRFHGLLSNSRLQPAERWASSFDLTPLDIERGKWYARLTKVDGQGQRPLTNLSRDAYAIAWVEAWNSAARQRSIKKRVYFLTADTLLHKAYALHYFETSPGADHLHDYSLRNPRELSPLLSRSYVANQEEQTRQINYLIQVLDTIFQRGSSNVDADYLRKLVQYGYFLGTDAPSLELGNRESSQLEKVLEELRTIWRRMLVQSPFVVAGAAQTFVREFYPQDVLASILDDVRSSYRTLENTLVAAAGRGLVDTPSDQTSTAMSELRQAYKVSTHQSQTLVHPRQPAALRRTLRQETEPFRLAMERDLVEQNDASMTACLEAAARTPPYALNLAIAYMMADFSYWERASQFCRLALVAETLDTDRDKVEARYLLAAALRHKSSVALDDLSEAQRLLEELNAPEPGPTDPRFVSELIGLILSAHNVEYFVSVQNNDASQLPPIDRAVALVKDLTRRMEEGGVQWEQEGVVRKKVEMQAYTNLVGLWIWQQYQDTHGLRLGLTLADLQKAASYWQNNPPLDQQYLAYIAFHFAQWELVEGAAKETHAKVVASAVTKALNAPLLPYDRRKLPFIKSIVEGRPNQNRE